MARQGRVGADEMLLTSMNIPEIEKMDRQLSFRLATIYFLILIRIFIAFPLVIGNPGDISLPTNRSRSLRNDCVSDPKLLPFSGRNNENFKIGMDGTFPIHHLTIVKSNLVPGLAWPSKSLQIVIGRSNTTTMKPPTLQIIRKYRDSAPSKMFWKIALVAFPPSPIHETKSGSIKIQSHRLDILAKARTS
jgi:hypothetical protein